MHAVYLNQQNNYFSLPNATNTVTSNHFQHSNDQLDTVSSKNITDRKAINITVTDTINFKPYHKFENTKAMLDYFSALITNIYQKNGIQNLDNGVKNFIAYNRTMKFMSPNRRFYNAEALYGFLCKCSLFISISIKTPHNNIANAIDYFFYRCTYSTQMKKDRIFFLSDTPIESIKQLATSKELYRYIRYTEVKGDISYHNLRRFSEIRNNSNNDMITKIKQTVYFCSRDTRKQTILKYINDILQLCTNKDIDINNEFVEFIILLATCFNITDTNIEKMLERIMVYLQSIADKNSYADIGMLINITCNIKGEIKSQLHGTIKTDMDVIKKYNFNSFPTQEKINAVIQDFNQDRYIVKENLTVRNQQLLLSVNLTKQYCYNTGTTSINDVFNEHATAAVKLELGITEKDIDLWFADQHNLCNLISGFSFNKFYSLVKDLTNTNTNS